ncbi:MAG: DUF4007 family protein [Acidobacteriota bacterium]|nr:DUF4007 family protein [Acidobacteriota bacterium]
MTEKRKRGHRQRLRDRFLSGDVESHSDEMLLELLLTFAIGRKDVKPLAEELIRVFGSLSKVLSASQDELAKVKGLGQSSVALLKVADFIATGAIRSVISKPPPAKMAAGATHQKLFQKLPNEEKPNPSSSNPQKKKQVESVSPSVAERKPESPENTNERSVSPPSSRPSKENTTSPKNTRRKFQVSNGYLLEFDQLARILHFLLENRQAKKINRKVLQEDTGLADRQVESLISIGAAMGLIKPGNQVLTPTGLLFAEHDIFIEKTGSLEWCHYVGAGSFRNLIWFEIFNHLLTQASAMTQEEWTERLRSDLAGKYGKRTISKGLYEEVRFVVDAYIEQNLKNLEILQRTSDECLYRRRYTQFSPLVISAMIYDFCAAKGTHLFQVSEMAATPGSPAMVFGLDAASFRQQIEGLHERGWLRYETTHNLDQIRLKPGLSALSFLSAHFEDREPREDSEQSPGGIFQ